MPDVTCVIDTGLQKVARYDAARAVDSLELERVSQDSADQRAGRAGRTRPGEVIRLWDPRDRLRPYREPEIARIDLAGPALEVLAWGGDPTTFEWFEAPPADALAAALKLLARLGAIDPKGRLTQRAASMQRFPLHPRLARLMLAAEGSEEAAAACALLSERHFLPPRRQATSCDLLAAIDPESQLPPHVRQAARQIRLAARGVVGASAGRAFSDESFRRAVLAAYPDRVARRRAPRSDRLVLSSGTGAKTCQGKRRARRRVSRGRGSHRGHGTGRGGHRSAGDRHRTRMARADFARGPPSSGRDGRRRARVRGRAVRRAGPERASVRARSRGGGAGLSATNTCVAGRRTRTRSFAGDSSSPA